LSQKELKIKDIKDTLIEQPWPVRKVPLKEVWTELYAKETGPDRAYSDFMEANLHLRHQWTKPWNLDDLLVIDCAPDDPKGWLLGTMYGEQGAFVVKIEPPGGEEFRKLTPFGREEYMLKSQVTGEACGLDYINEVRCRYHITLDLTKPKGREILKDFAAKADILFENYPPGQFDAWGIGYRQLSEINPALVYIWLGELGQWGSGKDRISKHGQKMIEPFGLCASEFVHSTGFPADQLPRERGGNPTRSGCYMADAAAAEHAFAASIIALMARDGVTNCPQLRGKGQFIESTAVEAYMELNDFNVTWYGMDGSIKARTGGWDPCLNQYAWNPCADGFMMIGGQTDRLWYRINQCLERDLPEAGRLICEDPILKEMGARNQLEMLVKTYTITAYWLARNPRAFAEKKLLEYGIASGPLLQIDEVCEYPEFIYRQHVTQVDDEHWGKLLVFNSPIAHAHRCPARIRWLARPVGFDTYEVFARLLGMGPNQVDELKKEGVV
jgi:crotonobetainyl-CoA:carnitine CoA-transferase CaiB-like acyl-CoA transferase